MLILNSPSMSTWEGFQTGTLQRPRLADLDVIRRWERARALGADAESKSIEGVSASDLTVRRARLEHTFREAYALLDRLTAHLAERGVVGLLADAEGVILASRGGGAFSRVASRKRLVEGARWTEAARGTNAIGTALIEGVPVTVRGRAHYERITHPLFCYATPIRDPSGEVVAALDVTGRIQDDDPALGLLVEATGSALEGLLRAQAYSAAIPGGLRILDNLLSRASTGALLIEAPGVVRLANEQARALLGLSTAEMEGRSVESLFGIPFVTLRDEALRHSSSLRIATDRITCTAELEPILPPGGQAFAVLVYLEPLVPFASKTSTRTHETPRHFPSVAPDTLSLRGSDPAIAIARLSAMHLGEADRALVYVCGPRGSGKKRIARLVHDASPRRHEPFMVIDSARPDAEDILFGPKRSGQGMLEQIGGGTLYLENFSQGSRTLQRRLVQHLTKHGVALVLSGETESKSLGGPLVERLTEDACIMLPSLAERSDKVELASYALSEGEPPDHDWELSDDARAWIAKYPWPGNLEELFQLIPQVKQLAGSSLHITARELGLARERMTARRG